MTTPLTTGSRPSITCARILSLVLALLWGAHLTAETITVGVSGDYQTIQGALDHAMTTAEQDEIHVEGPGTWNENLTATLDSSTDSVYLSGGWNADFSSRTGDPRLTVVDGDSGQVMFVTVSDGVLFHLSNLTLTKGFAPFMGGGLLLSANSDAEVFVYGVRFIDNTAYSNTAGQGAYGGGLFLMLSDAYAEVGGNTFKGNFAQLFAEASASDASAGGGALYVSGTNSTVEISGNWMEDDGCSEPDGYGTAKGCSLAGGVSSNGGSSFLWVYGNTILDTIVSGFSASSGVAGYIACGGSASTALVQENHWQGTAVTGAGVPDDFVSVIVAGGAELVQQSSLFADGPSSGLSVVVEDAIWHGVNLTVANHAGDGVTLETADGGTVSLYNSISYGNGGDNLALATGTTVDQGANLIGVDPGFINALGGHYHLRTDSVALDAGNATPPGELSNHDLDRRPRVQGTAVDIGAYEGNMMIFADGFEVGNTGFWSNGS